jgi:Phage protein Gp138 N-terminal domain
MSRNSPPSHRASSEDSLSGLLIEAQRKMLQALDVMLPARVISYDRATNIAVLQPSINMVTTDGQEVQRAPVSVRAFQYGGGGIFISFALEEGDLGWIKASDRDISLFLQTIADESAFIENGVPPNTGRMHSFSDGLFFPDFMPYGTFDPADFQSAVIQNRDQTSKIAISDGQIRLKTGGDISTESDSFTVDSDAKFKQKIGFYNVTPQSKPTVTGSKSGNAALASLLTQLASLGLITDSST